MIQITRGSIITKEYDPPSLNYTQKYYTNYLKTQFTWKLAIYKICKLIEVT